MKKRFNLQITNLLLAILVASAIITSCKKDDNNDPGNTENPLKGKEVVFGDTLTIIEGEIAGNRTLSADTTYLLKGFVYVVDQGQITIPAGTIIKGDKATMGSLIIERGGKIMAEGTAQKPIIFTSMMPVGARTYSDWGGIILCGKAPVNKTDPQIEGGPRTHYGGSNAHDNSGVMKYVRIEFAGYPFQPDKEINGLTFGGVGDGTVIDYICVAFSGDDSYEWFGGTVNCKHLVALYGQDDEFDTDYGFSGKLQYLLGVRDHRKADISGSNGFESDNDGDGSDQTPVTSAIFSNVSLLGPMDTAKVANMSSDFKRGMHLRRNTKLKIYNSLVAGWVKGIYVDGDKCLASAQSGDLLLKNSLVVGCGTTQTDTFEFGSSYTNTQKQVVRDWFSTNGNSYLKTTNEAGIRQSMFAQTSKKADGSFSTKVEFRTLNVLPTAGSPLLSGAFNVSTIDPFFDNVTYKGAFGNNNWTSGWVNFDPQNATY